MKVVLYSSKDLFLGSSMVEHSAVNRTVVGSSPTSGAKQLVCSSEAERLLDTQEDGISKFPRPTNFPWPGRSVEKFLVDEERTRKNTLVINSQR